MYKTPSGLCFEAKQIHSAPEFHQIIWKKNSFARKTRTRKASPYHRKIWIIEVRIIKVRLYYVFDYWRVQALKKLFQSRSHLIQNVRSTSVFYLRVCLIFFFYMYTRDDFLLHTFQMDICHFTYNSSEEPLVMLLWLFSRYLSSYHSA